MCIGLSQATLDILLYSLEQQDCHRLFTIKYVKKNNIIPRGFHLYILWENQIEEVSTVFYLLYILLKYFIYYTCNRINDEDTLHDKHIFCRSSYCTFRHLINVLEMQMTPIGEKKGRLNVFD